MPGHRRVPNAASQTRSSLMSCQLSVCHAFHTYRRASRHGLPRFSSFLSSSSYYYYSCYYSYSSLFLSFRFQLFFANFSLCSLTPSHSSFFVTRLLARFRCYLVLFAGVSGVNSKGSNSGFANSWLWCVSMFTGYLLLVKDEEEKKLLVELGRFGIFEEGS